MNSSKSRQATDKEVDKTGLGRSIQRPYQQIQFSTGLHSD